MDKEEKFIFNGKEYKTEAAMKAAITRAEKADSKEEPKKETSKQIKSESLESIELKLNIKHNGTRYQAGKTYAVTKDIKEAFEKAGVI